MSNNNPFADVFKSWSEFTPASADYKDALAQGRKNVEAFVSAGQIVTESLQSAASKQAEFARNSAQEVIDLWKEVASSKSVEASASKQAEFAKNSVEKGLNNSREIFEIASKASTEAYEVLSKQAQQAASEATKAAKKASNG